VARPTGARRLIELGKDILIAALTVSTVFLALQTPMADQLRGWVAPPAPVSGTTGQQSGRVVTPYALAVRSDGELYGVSYDDAAVARVFDQLSPYLGEALTAATAAEAATSRQFQRLLESPGFTCVFQGRPTLEALASSLNCGTALTGEAQALTLALDGGTVWLGWRSGDRLYRAATALDGDADLFDALDGYSPNGAAFAYTLSGSDAAYAALSPWELVTMTTPQPQVYTAATPDFSGDAAALGDLLSALGFLSGADAAYETAGGLAVSENGDRLQISRSGEIAFRAGEEARFPVSGGDTGQGGAVQCAWEVLRRAAGTWEGEAAFVLSAVTPTGRGWELLFQSALDGIPVLTGENGWCARFAVADGRVTDFTLIPRSYTAAGETSLVTSPRLAAAALRSLEGSTGQLILCYTDNRSATVTAGWLSQE